MTPLATRLATIAARAIGVDSVDPWASFFQLGGDSIVGVRLISQVNDEGIDLRLQDLFEAQSIVELADRLAARGAGVGEQPGGADVTGVTAFQRRLFEHAAPGRPGGAYRLDLTLDPDLDHDLPREAVRQVVARHPALRTRFSPTAEGGWSQVAGEVDEAAGYLPLIELGGLPAGVRAEARAQMVDEMREELEIERGAMFAAAVFDLGPDGRVLTMLGHELVVDPGSWEVLVAELLSVIYQLRGGDTIVLPLPTDPFLRWADTHPSPADTQTTPADARVSSLHTQTSPGTSPALDGAPQAVTRQMSREQAEDLADAVWRGYRLSVGEAALAALVLAARAVGLEGPLLAVRDRRAVAGMDVSRTVGAFLDAVAAPADLPDGTDLDKLLPVVKRWYRDGDLPPAVGSAAVAVQCIERYGERSRLERLLPPGNPAPWPSWEHDTLGAGTRLTVVEYDGLHLRWTTDGRPDRVTGGPLDLPALADAFEDALRRITEHGRAAARDRTQGDGRAAVHHLSPADFPLADLGVDELAAVLDDLEEDL